MEIQDYLKILKARWIIIAVTVVVAILGALGASLLTTPLYESSARMFVSTSGGTSVSETYQGNLFSQQRVASYSELVTSDALAARVLEVLPLDLTPSQLAAKVKASSTPDTVLFDITVTDASPARARDIANAMATELTNQVRELETPEDGGTPSAGVKTFQQADASAAPVSPKTKRNLALGAAVGLLLGIALAVLRDRLDNTIKNRREIESISGKALVGTIPFDKERKAHPAVDFQDLTQSASAEAFRELRTNLQFLEVDHPPRVIVVTSAIPSEGKTTTAVNLAVALAEAGHHVALVEGDLRRPRVSKYMGLIGSVGMSTVLAGQATVEEVLQPTKYEGLQAMASGPIPPNPSELLGSEASRALLVELRSRFDYVIVDGAPLLPVTDSAVLTTHADGALLVTRYGHTKSNEPRASDRQSRNHRCPCPRRGAGVDPVEEGGHVQLLVQLHRRYQPASSGCAPGARTGTARPGRAIWPGRCTHAAAGCIDIHRLGAACAFGTDRNCTLGRQRGSIRTSAASRSTHRPA